MVREEGKRNFALRSVEGEESVFSGNTPRHAALKAARRLEECRRSEDAEGCELRLREQGSDKVHIYEAWAVETDAPEDRPAWLGDTVVESDVTKKGIELE